MAETSITKTCRVCKTEKPIDCFGKHSRRKDGLNSDCRDCCRVANAKWRSRPEYALEHRENQRAYRQTDKHKEYYKEYTARPEVNEARKETDRRRYQENPEKTLARLAVGTAIEKKILKKPSDLICLRCPKPAAEYHHFSYRREHWTTVVALCESCHDYIHSLRPEENEKTCTEASARPSE